MNRYQVSIPRTPIGLAAFAFSALVIAATVVLPAKAVSANADAGIVASACEPAVLTLSARTSGCTSKSSARASRTWPRRGPRDPRWRVTRGGDIH